MTPTEGEALAPDLDRLAALAAHALQAPIVLAVIVSERSARVAGQAGHAALAGAEVGDPSFARRVAARGASSDAAALHGTWEARVTGARRRSACRSTRGSLLGVLLALDVSPRPWTADQLGAASTIARTVADGFDRHTLLARLSEAERLGAVLMRSPESIVIHVDGCIRFANPAALALFGGHAQEDVVGHAIERFILPPFLKHLEQTLVRPVPADGPPAVFEARLMRVDSAVRWVEVAALGYLRGDSPAVQLFVRDVTERRAARMALAEREAHLRLLIEQLPAMFWTTDADLRLLFVRTGALPSGAGRTVGEFFGRGPESVPVTTHRSALAGASATDIMTWQGSTFEVRVEPLRDEAGQVSGTVGETA